MAESCLHCGQTKAQIRANNTICGIEGGYEYIELIAEWPRHRWADWTDRELAGRGIKPEAYEEYRRCLESDFEWAECEDRLTGHVFAKEDEPEWGVKKGQCFDCGKMENA